MATAMHDPRLRAARGKFADKLDRNEDVDELQRLGCNKEVLINTLAFANVMPAVFIPMEANASRNLARDLDSIVNRMKRLSPLSYCYQN